MQKNSPKLKFRRLFRMSKAVFCREAIDFEHLKAISLKMSGLINIIDRDTMSENHEKNQKYFVKKITA